MKSPMLRPLSLSLALSTLIFASACPSDDSSDDEAASDTGDSNDSNDSGGDEGITDCTPPGLEEVVCQAGQYCADQVLGLCENGCLSNNNCAADQECIKEEGEDVGSCQNTGGTTTTTGTEGPTLEEFCGKALACDPMGTMEQCEMLYNATVAECHQCWIDSNCGDIVDGSCDMLCGF